MYLQASSFCHCQIVPALVYSSVKPPPTKPTPMHVFPLEALNWQCTLAALAPYSPNCCSLSAKCHLLTTSSFTWFALPDSVSLLSTAFPVGQALINMKESCLQAATAFMCSSLTAFFALQSFLLLGCPHPDTSLQFIVSHGAYVWQ